MTGEEWYGGPLRANGRGPRNGPVMPSSRWTAIMAKPGIMRVPAREAMRAAAMLGAAR
jgi:hypothetical protein